MTGVQTCALPIYLSGMADFDGFAGSAIQIQWLRASIPVPEGTAVVLVHAGDASGMASGHHSAEARVEERENALRLFMEQHFDWAQRIEVIDVRLAWDEAVTEEAVAASRWDFGLSDDTSVQGVVQMIPSTWLRDPARILARGQQEIASALRRLEQ